MIPVVHTLEITEAKFQEILASPDKFTLCWVEPWEGRREDGTRSDVCVEMRATATGCMEYCRRSMLRIESKEPATNENLLSSFIAVYLASLVKEAL